MIVQPAPTAIRCSATTSSKPLTVFSPWPGRAPHVLARPAHLPVQRDKVIRSNVLIVAGGCFAPLWQDVAIDGPTDAEAWRWADSDRLADQGALAEWRLEHAGLPADILRRLAPEPLVLRPIAAEEAERLAVRLRDGLPPALDGLAVDELSAALQGAHGWRGVAALIEQAWVDGHQPVIDGEDDAVNAHDTPAGLPMLAPAPAPKMIELPPSDQPAGARTLRQTRRCPTPGSWTEFHCTGSGGGWDSIWVSLPPVRSW